MIDYLLVTILMVYLFLLNNIVACCAAFSRVCVYLYMGICVLFASARVYVCLWEIIGVWLGLQVHLSLLCFTTPIPISLYDSACLPVVFCFFFFYFCLSHCYSILYWIWLSGLIVFRRFYLRIFLSLTFSKRKWLYQIVHLCVCVCVCDNKLEKIDIKKYHFSFCFIFSVSKLCLLFGLLVFSSLKFILRLPFWFFVLGFYLSRILYMFAC